MMRKELSSLIRLISTELQKRISGKISKTKTLKFMKKHLEIWWNAEQVFIFIPTFAFGECMPDVNNSYWFAFLFGPFRIGVRLVDNIVADNIAQD